MSCFGRNSNPLIDCVTGWVASKDQKASDDPLYISAALLPKILAISSALEVESERLGTADLFQPFFDMSGQDGLSSLSAPSLKLLCTNLETKAATRELDSVLGWAASRWFPGGAGKAARKSIAERCMNGDDNVRPQVFSTCTILIEAIACFAGASANKRNAKTNAALKLLAELAGQMPKPWRRELYIAAAVIINEFRNSGHEAVDRRQPAADLVAHQFSQFH